MQQQLDRDEPVRWKETLLEFRRWGWTMYRVAQAIDVPTSTLMGWFNDGKEPRFEHGRALLKLHTLEAEKRNSDGAPAARDVQPPRKERPMKARRAPKQVRQPGEEPAALPAQPGGESNVEEAIAAAQTGKARKIAKPRAAVAPSPIKGDPERPPTAAVNAKKEMTYVEAMKLREAGKLTRNVLTEQGWVVRNETDAERRNAMRVMPG